MNMEFCPTHKITLNDDVIPVMAEEGHDGGLILYTADEWESDSDADWEYSDADGLTRLGSPVNDSRLIRLEP